MNRRGLGAAGVALATIGLATWAQPNRKSHRIGFLGLSSASDHAPYLDAFLRELRDLGYEDGRNMTIEYRWADGHEERLNELAAQLVRLSPDLLVSQRPRGEVDAFSSGWLVAHVEQAAQVRARGLRPLRLVVCRRAAAPGHALDHHDHAMQVLPPVDLAAVLAWVQRLH